MALIKFVIATATSCALAQAVFADTAIVRTPAPVIHLESNLDEADGLGWCIDTVGRGYAEILHAHSCKPQGGDVQFSYDAGSFALRSVAFPGKCVVLLAPGSQTAFGLADCNQSDSSQRFNYDPETLALTPEQAPQDCLAVGVEARPAGPFMSRDLVKSVCGKTDAIYRSWIIRD